MRFRDQGKSRGARAILFVFSMSVIALSANASSDLEIIVKKSDLQKSRITQLHSIRSGNSVDEASVEKIRFNSLEDMHEALDDLESQGVHWEQNARFTGDVVSENLLAQVNDSDPLLGQQWSLINTGNQNGSDFLGADIDVVRAWSISKGGNVRIYFVDSGMVPDNAELGDRLVDYYDSFNPGEFSVDENGHGTHVFSVATALENDQGMLGVAPGSDIEVISVRILDKDNVGDTVGAVRAYEWISVSVQEYFQQNPEGRVIINNSWGGPQYSALLEDAMARLNDSRVLWSNSAGNEGQDNDQFAYFPCNFQKLVNDICTGATDFRDQVANFSSVGKKSVHILAPGFNVLGAVPKERLVASSDISGVSSELRYEDKSGTSQATPHVTGVAALVWGANPDLLAAEVKDVILKSVDRLPGAEAQVLSGGRINAYRAVLMATGRDPSLADRNLQSEAAPSSGGGCSANTASNAPALPILLLSMLLLLGRAFRSVRVASRRF